MKNWTHKVVKQSRGMQGQWFAHPTAATGSEAECVAYAERFAADQRAALGPTNGHRYLVLARKGNRCVKDIRISA